MWEVSKNKGFALIFSVVVVAVVTVITLALTTLTQKSLEISSAGQESQEAFFAADAGIECALYWDIHERGQNKFRGATPSDGSLTCDEKTVEYKCEDTGVGARECSFTVEFEDSEADVTLTLHDANAPATSDATVEALGHYEEGDTIITERGLRVHY